MEGSICGASRWPPGTGLFGALREARLSSTWTEVCPGGLKKSLTAYGCIQPEWAEERRCTAGSMMPATMWQEGAVRLEFSLLADSIFLISSYQTWKPRHPLYSGTITCWWLRYVNSNMNTTSQSSLAPAASSCCRCGLLSADCPPRWKNGSVSCNQRRPHAFVEECFNLHPTICLASLRKWS